MTSHPRLAAEVETFGRAAAAAQGRMVASPGLRARGKAFVTLA
jgi:hypothetical protein